MTGSLTVSERTLASLGFEDIRQALASRCRTEAGVARAQARPFLENREQVDEAYREVEEARRLKDEPMSLPIAGLLDIRTQVERAAKGAMLEPRDLMGICQALFAFERAHEVLAERKDRLPRLHELGRLLPVLTRLATRLDRSFEPSGEISDRASPELKEARDRARAIHRRIRSRLDELLREERFTVNLQETYYSVRNDRYVVPVKSSHQRDVTGIVHNASQSGQTLFVEPTELIGIGNELAIAQSLVLEEERKVLLELSGLVGREARGITEGVEAAARLDELEAVADLARDLDAATPVLEPVDGPLALKGLRHPRLVLKARQAGQPRDSVVANDVELSNARGLVVSGPNAGGKTVTLTGVGLCALMVRSGLPIPCDGGSRIPLFTQVHSAVGDQQDLKQGLSTFSAHVSVLKDIVTSAGQGALVLIDEIAADTNPQEGAAIATAVLEDLLERGAVVLVTTHLEELKALAHVDPRFVNARVGFDARRMAPTYRLQMGLAGSSSAIDIARRVGLPSRICERAQELATSAGGALSRAISVAEAEQARAAEARAAAEADRAQARAARAEVDAEREALARHRKAEELRYREALRAELEFARSQLRSLVDRLSQDRSDRALKAAQAATAELTQRINAQTVGERVARAELKGEVKPEPVELKVGAKARYQGFDAEVEILEVSGDTATVAAGALKMRVPVSQLSGTGKKEQRGQAARSTPARAEDVAAAVLTVASPTLDVRGQRAEDAVRHVEQFLDRVSRAGEASAIIIHGHGTGALKRELRALLEASPYARSFRPGDASEGGDGVTVVLL